MSNVEKIKAEDFVVGQTFISADCKIKRDK